MQRLFALCALTCAGMNASSADHRLMLQADTPAVGIALRDSRTGFLDLPALQFAFTIGAYCVDDLQPVSLLLSVADTRRILRPSETNFANDIELSLDIPANQLAPVAIRNFCVKSGAAVGEAGYQHSTEDMQLTLAATLTAQASLRCANDSIEQMVYVSKPLDITLVCQMETQGPLNN